MTDSDFLMSRPLSEKEKKEIKNFFKIKKPKMKKDHEISIFLTKNSKDFFEEKDNGFTVISKNIKE
jgi:hypothetical protein